MQRPPSHPEATPESARRDTDSMDIVWKALGNPNRRKMLDLLKEGPLTTGALSDHFPDLSRFGVMQHLDVLTDADLVVVVREGRERHNYLNPVPIQQIYDRWVSRYMQSWTDALTTLKSELESRSERSA